ncbi:unnamed protein product [Effrenium voratum]|nr:unnamed protein product [Effrenium voratum]
MEFPRPLQTVPDLRPAAVPSQRRPPAPSCTKEGRPAAKLACAAASGILQLARCQRRRVLRAAREDDHAVAVRNWLQKLVIGMNFCPWAKSVNEDNGIKVVTSLATTEDEVLSDLKREAALLPVGEAKTKPTTALVVCPYVAPWQDFAPFGDFFGEKLQNGVLLEDEFGVKLVGFHPQYEEEPLHGSVLDVGDVLTLPLKDEPEPVTVLDPAADADGEAFLVRRQDGGEELISYKRLTELLAEDDSDLPPETAEEEEAELESVEGIAQRAPRPTIHLLRLCDLSNALAEGVEVGDRVLEQNALSAQELGYAGWQRLMSQCEPAAKARGIPQGKKGPGSYSFRDGMSSLLRTLEEQLLIPGPGTVPAEIRRNSAAERLEAPGDARARVWLRDGSCVEADCVIAAVPPADLSQVLRQSGFEQAAALGVGGERAQRSGDGEAPDISWAPWSKKGLGLSLDKAATITGVEVESGVPAQPKGEQTRQGALNRLRAARATAEGARADFCIAFEGGVEEDSAGRLVCFAVVCVQFRDDEFISEVRSATHSIPPGIEKLINEGVELGLATDKFFAERVEEGYGKHTGGTIGALTFGEVDRVEFYAQPAALSLVPFLNAEAYGICKNPLFRKC